MHPSVYWQWQLFVDDSSWITVWDTPEMHSAEDCGTSLYELGELFCLFCVHYPLACSAVLQPHKFCKKPYNFAKSSLATPKGCLWNIHLPGGKWDHTKINGSYSLCHCSKTCSLWHLWVRGNRGGPRTLLVCRHATSRQSSSLSNMDYEVQYCNSWLLRS